MQLLKVLFKTMNVMGKRCFLYLSAIFFMSTSFAMFSVMGSYLMKNVVDLAQSNNTSKIQFNIIAIVVGGIVSLLIYRISAITYNVEAKRANGKMYKRLFYHELHLPYSYYETHHSGEFMSKISYDLEKMGNIYSAVFRRVIMPLLELLVFIIPMLLLSWQVTLSLLAINITMFLINSILINPIKNISKVLSNTNAKMTEKLSDLLQGMEQARMFPSGKDSVKAYINENEKYNNEFKKKNILIACLDSTNKGFDLLCALAFLMLGIFFVQKGYSTLGGIAAIYTLYGNFSNQFLQLGRYIPELIGSLTNAQRIFKFLEESEEPSCWYKENKNNNFEVKDRIDNAILNIEKVNFSYVKDKLVLNDFSLNVKKGDSVAIIGSSGCGKTTLSKLLLGLYPVDGGNILVNGKSYRDMTNEEIRNLFAYVPQDPYLFNLSIKENIRIGKPKATDEEVVQAAKIANAHGFIEKQRDGYDTYVGERGNQLSGGQRQRIAIARAIIKDAPVILLDEATAALDNESEQLVNDALKSLQNNKTIIMIAHRPSTIALANLIYAM